MKKTKLFAISFMVLVVSVVIVIAIKLPTTADKDKKTATSGLFSDRKEMTEEELFKKKLKLSKAELIKELKELDFEIANKPDKIVGLPTALALTKKKDEFTAQEILERLRKSDKSGLYEMTLVNIYIEKGEDAGKLVEFLDADNVSPSTKEEIVAKGNLDASVLEKLVVKDEVDLSRIAMKELMLKDAKHAYSLAENIFAKEDKMTDNQVYVASLAVGNYLKKGDLVGDERNSIIKKLQHLIAKRPNKKEDLARDRLVYALAEDSSFSTLRYILDNKGIDESLKITAIEKHLNTIIEAIKKGLNKEEKEVVIKAMNIMPILSVGEALEKVYGKGGDEDIQKTIEFIKKNGVEGVFKSEKE